MHILQLKSMENMVQVFVYCSITLMYEKYIESILLSSSHMCPQTGPYI